MDRSKGMRFSFGHLLTLFVGLAMGLAITKVNNQLRPRVAPTEAFAFDLPDDKIEPPDVVAVRAVTTDEEVLVDGRFLVGPDGKVNLGTHGRVFLSGQTEEQATVQIESTIDAVSVSVLDYNSKVYYLISDGNGNGGDQVARLPFTGTDTVLDALTHYPHGNISENNIWISRPTADSTNHILTVNLKAITEDADATQNYQLLPGDRLFVSTKGPPVTR